MANSARQVTRSLPSPILIFALGNPARGDDALALWLVKSLAREISQAHAQLIVNYQLQIEHALEFANRKLLLFIDAGDKTHAPFEFAPVVADQAMQHSTHSLSPAALLQVARKIEVEMPPAFALVVSGQSFALGDSLSTTAVANLTTATDFAKRLLAQPALGKWQQYLTHPPEEHPATYGRTYPPPP